MAYSLDGHTDFVRSLLQNYGDSSMISNKGAIALITEVLSEFSDYVVCVTVSTPDESSDSASLVCTNMSGVVLECGRVPLASKTCLRDVQAQLAGHYCSNIHPNVSQQKVKLISAGGHLFSDAALDLPIEEVFG